MFTFNTDEMDNVKRGYFRYPSAKISAENAKALSNCIVVHPDAGRSAATTFFCSGAPCVEPATPAMGASFPVQMLAHNDQGKTTTRNVQGRTLVGASIFPNATDKSRVIFQRTLPGSLIGKVFRSANCVPVWAQGGAATGNSVVMSILSRPELVAVATPALREIPDAMARLAIRPHAWGPFGLCSGANASDHLKHVSPHLISRLGLGDESNPLYYRGPTVAEAPSIWALLGKPEQHSNHSEGANARLTTMATVKLVAGALGVTFDLIAKVGEAILDAEAYKGSPETSHDALVGIVDCADGDPFPVAADAHAKLTALFATCEAAVRQGTLDRRRISAAIEANPPAGLDIAADANGLLIDNYSFQEGAVADMTAPVQRFSFGPGLAGAAANGSGAPGVGASAPALAPAAAGGAPAAGPPQAPPGPVPTGGALARAQGATLLPPPTNEVEADANILSLATFIGWELFFQLGQLGHIARPADDAAATLLCWQAAKRIVSRLAVCPGYAPDFGGEARPRSLEEARENIVLISSALADADAAGRGGGGGGGGALGSGAAPTEETIGPRVKVSGAKDSELANAPAAWTWSALDAVDFASAAAGMTAPQKAADDAVYTQASAACANTPGAPEALARVIASNGRPRAPGGGGDVKVSVPAWPLAARDEVACYVAECIKRRLPERAIGLGASGAGNPSAANAAALQVANKLLTLQFTCNDIVPFVGQSISHNSTDAVLGGVKSKETIVKTFSRLVEPLDLILGRVIGCADHPSGEGCGGLLLHFIEWMVESISMDVPTFVYLLDNHVLYALAKAAMAWRSGTSATPPPDMADLLKELRVNVKEHAFEARQRAEAAPGPRSASGKRAPHTASPPSSGKGAGAKRPKALASPAAASTPTPKSKVGKAPAAPAKTIGPSFRDRWNSFDAAIGASNLDTTERPCFPFFCGLGCTDPCKKGRRHTISAAHKAQVIAAKNNDGSNLATPEHVTRMNAHTSG